MGLSVKREDLKREKDQKIIDHYENQVHIGSPAIV